MRMPFSYRIVALLIFVSAFPTGTVAVTETFTTNLSLGSKGQQVLALQQALNRDPATQIAASGPGSPGNESDYFGPRTKAAVIRFQEKYASDILVPAGLAKGNGRVGSYTRARLNALSVSNTESVTAPTTTTAPSTKAKTSSEDYLVKDSEKIDIYVGDKMLKNIHDRIMNAVDLAIASRGATPLIMPKITLADVPSISISVPSPHSGIPGTYVSINGTGVGTNSVLYFGSKYVLRTVTKGLGENVIFIVPTIPPGLYDIAIRSGGVVSNTTRFVITNPKNPPVRLQSVSPTTIKYGDTLTLTGSGFSKENNVVVTTYQTITNVPSPEGTTLTVQLTPPSLESSAKFGGGGIQNQMSVYVVSDYGFSTTVKSFTMTL